VFASDFIGSSPLVMKLTDRSLPPPQTISGHPTRSNG
jgi:hypothetical protein